MKFVVKDVMTPDGREWLAVWDHVDPQGRSVRCAVKGDSAIEAMRRAIAFEEDTNEFEHEPPEKPE